MRSVSKVNIMMKKQDYTITFTDVINNLVGRYQKENPVYINVPPSTQWFPSVF